MGVLHTSFIDLNMDVIMLFSNLNQIMFNFAMAMAFHTKRCVHFVQEDDQTIYFIS